MMAAIGIVLLGGMGVGIGMDGVNASKQSKNIRDQISDVEGESKKWEDRYTTIMRNDYRIEAEDTNYIRSLVENYNVLANQIKVQRDAYNVTFKKIQLWGIIFVTSIFFMLLLKQFKLLGPLLEIIEMPFKYTWNYVVHGNVHYGEKKKG